MLDKSLSYIDIIMRRPALGLPPPAALPEGYRFAFYGECAGKNGTGMGDWAEIETSVLEFDNVLQARIISAGIFCRFFPRKRKIQGSCLYIPDHKSFLPLPWDCFPCMPSARQVRGPGYKAGCRMPRAGTDRPRRNSI